MMTKKINVTTTVLLSVLTVVLFQISGKTSNVRPACCAGPSGCTWATYNEAGSPIRSAPTCSDTPITPFGRSASSPYGRWA